MLARLARAAPGLRALRPALGRLAGPSLAASIYVGVLLWAVLYVGVLYVGSCNTRAQVCAQNFPGHPKVSRNFRESWV